MAIRHKSCRSGVIPVQSNQQSKLLLVAMLFLTFAVCGLLNWPGLFFEPLPWLPRIAVPLLLLSGLVGVATRFRALIIIGWLGIAFYVFLVLATAIPGEDLVLASPTPNAESGWFILFRFAAQISIAVGLVICMRRLSGPGHQTQGDVNSDAR